MGIAYPRNYSVHFMHKEVYTGMYAGHPVRYQFLHQDTCHCFGTYLIRENGPEADIRMSWEYFQKCRKILGNTDPDCYVEYKGLISLTSQYLLKYSCCIFHAVSFIYKGYAWLLTGPSGTGKTTQYMNWKALYPQEIIMLCGDMPLLELTSDDRITVYPTGWNGKENIGSKKSAPLGGMILLKQGPANDIRDLSVHDGIVPIFRQFRTIKETEEDIRTVSSITDCIFRRYPVWEYTNCGDNASTQFLRSHINAFCRKKGIF